MKIYTKQHETLQKVVISQQGLDSKSITLHDTTFADTLKFFERQVNTYGSVVKKGRSTSVRIKEYQGAFVKGKDRMITFYGLTPQEFYEIIVDILK